MGYSMQMGVWWVVGLGGLVSLVAPTVLRPVLERNGIIDRPNDRSSHRLPTLRAGGVAPLIGFMLACALLAVLVDDHYSRSVIVTVGLGAALAGLLGLAEDVHGLSVATRATGHIVVGVVMSAVLGAVLAASWWQVATGALVMVVYVNVANFMDGINGISGLHGLAVGGAYALFGLLSQIAWMVLLGMIVAAAFAVFLPWNLRRPGIFLGDVGSYLLGSSIAGLGVAAWFAGVDPIAVLAPSAIYYADTISTLGRRVVRKEPILRAHRSHTYQRLTDTGLSHIQVATIVTLFSVATAVIGLVVLRGRLGSWSALLLIAGTCALYLALPRFRGHRLPRVAANHLKPFELPPPVAERPDLRPERWAVLGASGFVGSALVSHLRSLGYEVDQVPAPRLALDPASDEGDAVAALALGRSELDELVATLHGADVVVNSAGLATPDAPADDELYGANALLPPLVYHAAERAGARRTIHLSSAAVQGHRPVLDETADASPFSPYSRSKALGERAFLAAGRTGRHSDAIVIRATSVQGAGRRTTTALRRISRSPLASVAGAGREPTVVSSIDGLVDFIGRVSVSRARLGPILLQPWEGFTVSDVLRAASGVEPRHLPSWVCRALLACTRRIGSVVPEVAGAGRRLEMMWLGQRQTSAHQAEFPAVPRSRLESILSETDAVA